MKSGSGQRAKSWSAAGKAGADLEASGKWALGSSRSMTECYVGGSRVFVESIRD